MKISIIFLVALVLSSCSTKPASKTHSSYTFKDQCAQYQAENKCAWHQTNEVPQEVKELSSTATTSSTFSKGNADHSIEQWFSTSNGNLMLRKQDQHGCDGGWWIFIQENGRWIIAKQETWACVI